MSIGTRIRKLRNAAGYTQADLAKKLGNITRESISQWETDGTLPEPERLADIAAALGSTVGYIMNDESEPAGFQGQPSTLDSSPWATVPEYVIHVSAGGGAIVEAENIKTRWPFNTDYLEGELRIRTEQAALVEVRGDSMEPTLSSGDKVMVDLSDLNVSQGGVFVVYDGDATVVKRVEKVYDATEPTIALISDNEKHRRYEVPAERVVIVGRVIWAARRL